MIARPVAVNRSATSPARAAERGEIDPDRLTPRIVALPGDLLRHELLMNLRPATPETITEIVDEVFLPLVRKSS